MLNQHKEHIPRATWHLQHERQTIIEYGQFTREEGYRRLCYRMIDEGVVYANPSSVYRVLHDAGLLCKFLPAKKRAKGVGYE